MIRVQEKLGLLIGTFASEQLQGRKRKSIPFVIHLHLYLLLLHFLLRFLRAEPEKRFQTLSSDSDTKAGSFTNTYTESL